MRNTSAIILTLTIILLISACSKKKRLEGTWFHEYSYFSPYENDSLTVVSFYENTGTTERYQLDKSDAHWTFFKYTVNEIDYSNISFISKDKYVYMIPDSLKEKAHIRDNFEFTRVSKDIKPHRILLSLYNNFFQEMSRMTLDTVFDGSIFCSLKLEEQEGETLAEMGNKIKYFFDKEMQSLPVSEETFKYDKVEGAVYDHYIWENLEVKVEIRVYPFDEANIPSDSSKRRLELRCWLNVK